jgi:hypothetical protein
MEAHRYAQDVQRDIWQFAVETDTLAAAGLLPNDFRWLVLKGYVDHAREVTGTDDLERVFRPNTQLMLSERTCFVLTEAGMIVAQGLSQSNGHIEGLSETGSMATERSSLERPVPKWDEARRELTVAGKIVKQFRLPSPNQEMVLTALEEEGWPPSISDPLPPYPGQDPKRRLQDTLKALNNHQKHRLIRFKGNGTGEGILWELTEKDGSEGL